MTTTSHKNTRTRNLLFGGAVLLVAVFLLGFVPQFRKTAGLSEDLRKRDHRIEQFEREASIAKARDLASLLYLELTRKNYGIAAEHATEFFNHVRTMLTNASDPARKAGFENMIGQRDAIIANIAKADSAAELKVRDILYQLHQIKGP